MQADHRMITHAGPETFPCARRLSAKITQPPDEGKMLCCRPYPFS